MNFLTFLWQLIRPKPERPSNTGVVLGNQPTDYIAGVNSPIPYKLRLPDGNWTPYTWSKVHQWCMNNGVYVDQLSCTTNALITAIEAQEFFLTGKQVRYSRRWVAKMSGTNQGALKGMGNYMYKPADWVNNNGLVLESSYPTPDSYTQDEFYQDIPEPLNSQLMQEGKEWLKKWNLDYEFLEITDPNLDYHLKHAPITVVIPGHDICGIYSPADAMQYRDSYEPWDKSVPESGLQAAMKAILTPTTLDAGFAKWNDGPEVWFFAKLDSMERLKKFQDTFSKYDSDYTVNPNIIQLPTKKPF